MTRDAYGFRPVLVSLRRVLAVLFLVGSLGLARAHAQSPTGLWVSPDTIYKAPSTQDCYTILVGNGANMPVDVLYSLDGGPEIQIPGWPTLNASGEAYICTDSLTVEGTYTFTGVRRSGTGADFLSVNATLIVAPTPPQLSGLTFSPTSGYAGNSSYTLHAVGGPWSLMDLQYAVVGANGSVVTQGIATIPLDGDGNWSHVLAHDDAIGEWRFSGMKNHYRSDWVGISVSYTIRPPNPISFAISPSTVGAGRGAYTMSVGNGANVTLDVRYSLDSGTGEVPAPDILGWPLLSPAAYGSAQGVANIQVGPCTRLGTYRFKFVENTLNPGLWIPAGNTAAVTVTAPLPPTSTTRSPLAAKPGSSVPVVISGTNLCGVVLSTTYPGLSFGTIPDVVSSDGTAVTVTATVAANALPGTATVILTARGGTTSFPFYVSSSAPPTLSGISPGSAEAGSTAIVSVSGTNLIGAVLSSNPVGLTFQDLSYGATGNTITGKLLIAPSMPPGYASISVATPSGVATRSFLVTAAGSGTIQSSREYIYLHDRLLAVETTSIQPPPPTRPTLGAQVLSATTVQLQWQPSTAGPGLAISGYQVKRGNVVVATLGPSQWSYLDTGAAQNSDQTYSVLARDNWAPVPQSVSSNPVAVRTPREQIPPTAPGNLHASVWDSHVQLMWSPSTDSGGSGLAGYAVGFAWSGEPFSGLLPAAASSYLIDLNWWPGMDWMGFYGFAVYAMDNAGNWSAPVYWP